VTIFWCHFYIFPRRVCVALALKRVRAAEAVERVVVRPPRWLAAPAALVDGDGDDDDP